MKRKYLNAVAELKCKHFKWKRKLMIDFITILYLKSGKQNFPIFDTHQNYHNINININMPALLFWKWLKSRQTSEFLKLHLQINKKSF